MDKIDIRTLSVDNWVYNSKHERCRVCSIEGIGEQYASLDNYDKPNDGCFEAECDMYGIPLTEEILLSNGYHKENAGDFDTFLSNDGRILVSNDTDYLNTNNKWWVHIDDEDMDSIGGLEISHVHQFQNLLRTAEIKETIKL